VTSIVRPTRSAHEIGDPWTSADASELYEVARWGQGYFSVAEDGSLHVNPTKEPGRSILGDLHNLLGDTHAVHVSLDERGEVILDTVIKGDTVREVLKYVGFSSEALVSKLRTDIEAAVRNGRLHVEESGRLLQFYEDGLNGYAYLEERGPAR
jgi:arginine decarboxylase-like protein